MAITKTASTILDSATIAGSAEQLTSAIDMSSAIGGMLTTMLTFDASATAGAVLYVYTSAENMFYDTIPIDQLSVAVDPGNTVQVSLPLIPSAKYAIAKIVNLDSSYSITYATVFATVTTT